jgi:hypothetical protein
LSALMTILRRRPVISTRWSARSRDDRGSLPVRAAQTRWGGSAASGPASSSSGGPAGGGEHPGCCAAAVGTRNASGLCGCECSAVATRMSRQRQATRAQTH